MVIKTKLQEKTGYKGFFLPDLNLIYVDNSDSQKEFLITIFHELFHFFFHDEFDDRKKTPNYRIDPIERRAENSAKNTYGWYVENSKLLNKLLTLVSTLPVSELTSQELEDIR